MPTLDWIGKQAVVGHHRRVPYRLLHCDRALCRLGAARLKREGVVFKQVPCEVKVSEGMLELKHDQEECLGALTRYLRGVSQHGRADTPFEQITGRDYLTSSVPEDLRGVP
jgi:hypothetical protein